MKHFSLLLHFEANYIEPAATFDGRCSFCLLAKNKTKTNHTFPPEFLIYFGFEVLLFSDIYHKCLCELDIFLKNKNLFENTQETSRKNKRSMATILI